MNINLSEDSIVGAEPAAQQAGGLIKLAILAVGGQGGGVLTDWIVALAESNGYAVQATSVPGVAQRTGATIYYVEMLPVAEQAPILALMPTPGDVDIVIAAEAMEAGRAITRGLVTPDRTTLIASSHRMFAVSEKIVPGDGIVPTAEVTQRLEKSAKDVYCHDLAEVAERHGAHISASLFGALAGSGKLPFPREKFEQTIGASGRGVEASLRAFADSYALTSGTLPDVATSPQLDHRASAPSISAPQHLVQKWKALAARVDDLPGESREIALAGLRKVVDYQDLAYGTEYLDLLAAAAVRDSAHSGAAHGFRYTTTLAKHLANAMCYDDVIRIADLKTRGARTSRVRDDVSANEDTVVKVTEYLHPRAEEIIATMPAGLGRYVERSRRLRSFIEARCRRGKRWRSDALGPFIVLYAIGGMHRWRRRLLRHEREVAHRDRWLGMADACLPNNYDLAIEVLKARRLIKGYSDTHARGTTKFERVLDGIRLVEHRSDAVAWARRLMSAALAKVEQDGLEDVIRTIESFAADDG